MRKQWSFVLGAGMTALLVGGYAGAQVSPEDEAELRLQEQLETAGAANTMSEILRQLQRQQQMLDRISDMVDRQRKSLDEVNARLKAQEDETAALKQQLAAQQAQLANAAAFVPGGTYAGEVAVYSADKQFASAKNLMRTAIFDVRRKDAEPYFLRAIEEFRAIVDQYPQSSVADEAQAYICKIYHRYLMRREDTRRECEKFMALYPDSEVAPEVQDIMAQLGMRSQR